MLIFLSGPDTFRSRKKLQEVKEKFLREVDPSGINLTVLRDKDLTLEKVREAVGTQSFFAKKRMVVIENGCFRDKKFSEKVLEYLSEKSIEKDTIIVFWQEEQEKKKKESRDPLFEKLQKEKYAQKFSLLRPWELEKWLDKELSSRKMWMKRDAKQLLLAALGNDLWQFSSELDKLENYANGKEIALADIYEMGVFETDDNIFHLIDAISTKLKKKAVEVFSQQIRSGANELYLFSMIVRQFQLLLKAKQVLEEKPTSASQLATQLLIHPYAAQKLLAVEKNFTFEELKYIFRRLVDTEVNLKTGAMPPKLALSLLLVDILKP